MRGGTLVQRFVWCGNGGVDREGKGREGKGREHLFEKAVVGLFGGAHFDGFHHLAGGDDDAAEDLGRGAGHLGVGAGVGSNGLEGAGRMPAQELNRLLVAGCSRSWTRCIEVAGFDTGGPGAKTLA